MPTWDLQKNLIATLKRWIQIEGSANAGMGKIIASSDNRFLRLIMEIIQHDSRIHSWVQELILDSFERKPLSLSPEELGAVWEMLEEHIKYEKETIELGKQALEATKGRKMTLQRYLLEYLLEDEQKHENMMKRLTGIKEGFYP